MTIRLPYETKAGNFDETVSYMQLIEHLRLAAECAYVIGHHRKANDDTVSGQGFLGVGQYLEKIAAIVGDLATKGHVIQ